MITERLMGVGAWSLELRADTPRPVLDAVDVRRSGFGHVVVTPTPVNVSALPDATILGAARFVGVFRKQPSEFGMSGAGVNMWVADEDGKGAAYVGRLSTVGGTFAQWVAVLTPTFLASGITSAIAGTYEKWFHRVGLREPLDEITNFFGAEWRVTNDFKFDAGTPAELFRMDPKAVILRKRGDGGLDFNVTGIVGELEVARDLEDWTRRVVYFTGTEDAPVIHYASGGVLADDVPYRSPDGSVILMDRLIEGFNAADAPAVPGDAIAAAEYGQVSSVRQELRLNADEYDIGQDVRVGDNVYVYDPVRGIQDQATAVQYRGRMIYPETIRCVGLTYPIREGMGVYFRYFTKPATTWVVNYVDLTPYMVWQSGATEVEVGALPRRS